MQPFPGADIWDIIYYTDAGIAKVNYDIIIHVGTNNVCNHKLADFDYAYNVLFTTVERRKVGKFNCRYNFISHYS